MAAVMNRRSLANGALARSPIAISSISISSRSSSSSSCCTRRASSSSRSTSDLMDLLTALVALLAMVSSFSFRAVISCSKWSIRGGSTESSGHVIFGLFLRRVGEDLARRIELDQLTQIEKGRVIGDARGLLHVVGHDNDGELFFQFEDQVLDLGRVNRVERRSRFVHEQHFRLYGQGAHNAKPLLLAARETQGRCVEAVFDI